jgi:hypothetical protein
MLLGPPFPELSLPCGFSPVSKLQRLPTWGKHWLIILAQSLLPLDVNSSIRYECWR